MKITELTDIIEAGTKQEQIGIDLFDKLVEIFKPFEGKKISRRMETAVKKAMPELTVHYSTDYGMYQMVIWGGHVGDYNNRMSFLMGYEKTSYNPDAGVYRENCRDGNVKGFRDFACCYGEAAKKRNENRDSLLSDPVRYRGLVADINAYLAAKEALDKYDTGAISDWYKIKDAAGIDRKV